MPSSGFTFWTIFWNNFSNGFFRIYNSNNYESEKHKEISNHSKSLYMILKYITIFENSVPYISLGNAIWTLFILDITISEYLTLLGYIWKISNFLLNGIQIPRFFKISRDVNSPPYSNFWCFWGTKCGGIGGLIIWKKTTKWQ